LFVSEDLLVATWRALRECAARGCEGTVRWAGPAFQSRAPLQIATTVVVPRQRVGPGAFEVPHDATRMMADALAADRLVNLAQLHSHPGDWVGHSGWDDQRAYSSRDGALSVVWPDYARALPAFDAWGVHESCGRRWVRLSTEDARARIIVLPGMSDLRVALDALAPADSADGEVDDDAELSRSEGLRASLRSLGGRLGRRGAGNDGGGDV
jgi:hypothetical protein